LDIQLVTSDVKLKVKYGEKVYELKRPKVGHLKAIDQARKNEGDVVEAMEKMLVAIGLPSEVFDDLEVDQLEQLMTAINGLLTPKKNSTPSS